MDTEIEEPSAAEEAPSKTEEEFSGLIDPDTLSQFLSQFRPSIFIAPEYIRNDRASDFEPKLVSIGPYYHGRENLREMEHFKLQCLPSELLGFEKRVGGGIQNPTLLDPFMSLASCARSCYRQNEQFNSDDVDFVRMLVFDSCFIIRAILSYSHREVPENLYLLIFNRMKVRSDLFLMENQIPLHFIASVYDRFFRRSEPNIPPFETVLEPFICFDMPWRINYDGINNLCPKLHDHLLQLYWRCSLSPLTPRQLLYSSMLDIAPPKLIPNASALHQMAGIKFEKLNHEGHHVIFLNKGHRQIAGLNVTLSNGIMRMPCLKIDSSQIPLLVNLIAFENSQLPSRRTFSSYMKLMDALIESEKDVELLQDCGVIHNTLSSHQMAVTFVNDIGKVCFFNDPRWSTYFDLFRDVHKYYDSSWNRTWASLRRNYFSSPWAVISVGAGGTLLILGALQTFYTIYSYYHPKH